MAEQTLALKLDGGEIRKALVDAMQGKFPSSTIERIDRALSRDWSMNPATSYDSFEGSIVNADGRVTVSLTLHDTGREYQIALSVASELDEEKEVQLDRKQPNVVRVETGQPVPALVKQGDNPPTVKKIQYARDKAPKPE
jgi:hypothetical protein